MMYTVLFERGLEKEAKTVRNALRKVYGVKCATEESDLSGLLRWGKILGGYVIRRTKKFKNKIALTKKELFPYGSKSKADDWIFGYSTNQKSFIISVKRLKSDPKLYRKRLESIAVHELGHWLVKHTKHYKLFVWVNPKTGHRLNLGMHCMDKRCVMSQTVDIRQLDAHLKNAYKGYFCKKCRPK